MTIIISPTATINCLTAYMNLHNSSKIWIKFYRSFCVDSSSSIHVDNKKKDILILGKSPTDRLDDTAITAKAEYSIYFTEQQTIFCLSLYYYNWSSSFLC